MLKEFSLVLLVEMKLGWCFWHLNSEGIRLWKIKKIRKWKIKPGNRRHSPFLPLLFAHCSSLPHGHKQLDFIVASPQLNSGCLGRVKRVL